MRISANQGVRNAILLRMDRHPTATEEGFFQFHSNVAYRSRFVWAYSLTPRLDTIWQRCDVCNIGHVFPDWYPEIPLAATVDKKRKYPDILGCGAWPLRIVSQAVLDDWTAVGVKGYETFPLEVRGEAGSPRLDAPAYYHLKITGRCELDTDAMGIKILFRCPKCRYKNVEPIWPVDPIIKRDTWDGSDLFSSDLFPMQTFCTEAVRALTNKNRRTNFRFESLSTT
jgi:hypothetical protein